MVHIFTLLASTTALILASRPVMADASSNSIFSIRQVVGFDPSTIPTQCSEDQTGCRALMEATQACQTPDCLCTNAVASNMKSCSECVLKLDMPGFNQTVAEQSAQAVMEGCKAAGKPITVDIGSAASSGAGASSVSTSSGSQSTLSSTTSATKPANSGQSRMISGVHVAIVFTWATVLSPWLSSMF